MPPRLLASFIAAAFAADCTLARPVDSEAELVRRVDALLAARVAAREFSGAVVLTRGGREVYARGFGLANHAAGLAFTPDTPSDGGSLAKTFTAAGLWWLAHEGRVDLDAPVTRYVPEFPHPATTVRHLLAHSNGLPAYYEYFDAHFAPGEVRTTTGLLQVTARTAGAPSFAPGTRFEYSNLGFDVAALVIERVTGQEFEAFVRARFFTPLGMTASFARPPRLADWRGVRTLGYAWRDDAWQVVDVFDHEAFLGASNLYFPARDLSRWARAHAAGSALPPAVLAVGLRRPRIAGQPSPMTGLSWYCDGDDTRGYYTGSVNAFHSLVYWDRARDESVVMVSNSSLPPWPAITLQRALVAALAGRALDEAPTPAFVALTRGTRAGAAGAYDLPGIGRVHVTAHPEGERTRLRLRIGDGLTFDLFGVGHGVFYAPGPDYWVAFSGGTPPQVLHVRSMFVDAAGRRAREAGTGRVPD